jgi:hypothetical protein
MNLFTGEPLNPAGEFKAGLGGFLLVYASNRQRRFTSRQTTIISDFRLRCSNRFG